MKHVEILTRSRHNFLDRRHEIYLREMLIQGGFILANAPYKFANAMRMFTNAL